MYEMDGTVDDKGVLRLNDGGCNYEIRYDPKNVRRSTRFCCCCRPPAATRISNCSMYHVMMLQPKVYQGTYNSTSGGGSGAFTLTKQQS